MWTLAYRDGETFRAYLVDLGASKGYGIGILRSGASGDTWDGLAMFPRELVGEAARRYTELVTDADIEAILREWADPDGQTLTDFIAVVAQEDSPLHGDDLPQFLIPAAGITRKVRKAIKQRIKQDGTASDEVSIDYVPRNFPRPAEAEDDEVQLLPLDQYDNFIVSFSGGKDSVACALHLMELGVPAERIELWHQCVDGRPSAAGGTPDERMWDWPCTESYCEAFAHAFGMRLLYQWIDGGFLGELTKIDRRPATSRFQTLNGSVEIAAQLASAKKNTRLAWPAMAADLRSRWCSSSLKIDPAKKVFTNDPRFNNSKSLILTGERRQESGNRAKYANTIDYSSAPAKGRVVHQWRAVLGWFEQDVWEIIARYHVRPHPAYYLGWSRLSCICCIFSGYDQWASVAHVAPKLFTRLANLEDKFFLASQQVAGHPMSEENQRRRHDELEDKRREKEGSDFEPKEFWYKQYNGWLRAGESLPEAAAKGTSYVTTDLASDLITQSLLHEAMSEEYPKRRVLLHVNEPWDLPKGAYHHSGGPI